MTKLNKKQIATLEGYKVKVAELEAVFEAAEGKELPEQDAKALVSQWNELADEVGSFCEGIAGQIEEYMDERSDAWQESDKGEAFRDWLEDWTSIEADHSEYKDGELFPPENLSEQLETLKTEPEA